MLLTSKGLLLNPEHSAGIFGAFPGTQRGIFRFEQGLDSNFTKQCAIVNRSEQ